VQLDVQVAVDDAADVPDAEQIQVWANAAVQYAEPERATSQMTVRIVELDEITQLNEQYRQKTGPTNVLSFPFDLPPGMPAEAVESELGDVVVCADVVRREAVEQEKPLVAHWAHMIVHGTLHLLGYDHIQDADAQQMETLEIAVLAELGYANPYS
jgi:probable rRNA maturation factor